MTVWGLTNSYNGTPPLPTPKVQPSVDVKHICAPHAHTRDGGGRDQLHGGDHGELEPERLRRQGENVSGRDGMRVEEVRSCSPKPACGRVTRSVSEMGGEAMLSPKTPRSRFPCQETRKVPGSLGPQTKMSWSRVAPSPLRNLGIVCSQSLT